MNASEEELESEFVDEDPSRLVADEGEDAAVTPASVKQLREKLKKTVEEKQENLDGWQRARADLANFKRDEMQRSEELEIRLKSKVAETLIPTLDSFEMALRDESFVKLDEGLQKGFGATYSHLLKSLESLGISRFDPTGEKFDPHKHEALREVATDESEKDHAIESVQRAGYSVLLPDNSERIIRPAQVSVYIKK